tara:strand:- start:260 stop:550 length:291 start_codon:yes stop_codon:yes gene_type:complete
VSAASPVGNTEAVKVMGLPVVTPCVAPVITLVATEVILLARVVGGIAIRIVSPVESNDRKEVPSPVTRVDPDVMETVPEDAISPTIVGLVMDSVPS